MLSWDLFHHYLFSRRSGALIRSIARLSVCSIGVGVFALVVVVGVMNGFNNTIRDKLLSAEPHLIVYTQPSNKNEVIDILDKETAVKAYPFETQDVIVRTLDGFFSGAVARGIEPEALEAMLKRIYQSQSKKKKLELSVAELSSPPQEGEIIMGAELARSLGLFEGEQVVVLPPEALLMPAGEAPPYERVTIKRLLSTELSEIDSQFIYYTLGKSFSRLSKTASREAGFEIFLPDPEKFEDLKSRLLQTGAKAQSWVERNGALFFALKLEKLAMSTFLSLATLITSFSIFSILVLLLTQKRRDLGVLMAMGLSSRRTRKLFGGVGLFLSGIGMGTGLILGLVVSYLMELYPLKVLPEEVYYDSSISAKLQWEMLVAIVLGCVVVALVASFAPVARFVKMRPSEALRDRQIN